MYQLDWGPKWTGRKRYTWEPAIRVWEDVPELVEEYERRKSGICGDLSSSSSSSASSSSSSSSSPRARRLISRNSKRRLNRKRDVMTTMTPTAHHVEDESDDVQEIDPPTITTTSTASTSSSTSTSISTPTTSTTIASSETSSEADAVTKQSYGVAVTAEKAMGATPVTEGSADKGPDDDNNNELNNEGAEEVEGNDVSFISSPISLSSSSSSSSISSSSSSSSDTTAGQSDQDVIMLEPDEVDTSNHTPRRSTRKRRLINRKQNRMTSDSTNPPTPTKTRRLIGQPRKYLHTSMSPTNNKMTTKTNSRKKTAPKKKKQETSFGLVNIKQEHVDEHEGDVAVSNLRSKGGSDIVQCAGQYHSEFNSDLQLDVIVID